MNEQDIQRFWSKVDTRGPEECWFWKASRKGEYGQFHYNRRSCLAHRMAFLFTHGLLPEDKNICHTCDHPLCCNPGHLFQGTQLENKQDCIAKGRVRAASGDEHGLIRHPERRARGERHGSQTQPDSVPRGEGHGNAKLTDALVLVIREAYGHGASQSGLARIYGLSVATVSLVVRRKRWTHV